MLRLNFLLYKFIFQDKAWKSMKVLNDNASNNGPYHWMPIKVHFLFDFFVLIALVSVNCCRGSDSCSDSRSDIAIVQHHNNCGSS